jgi:hypothetical protein
VEGLNRRVSIGESESDVSLVLGAEVVLKGTSAAGFSSEMIPGR